MKAKWWQEKKLAWRQEKRAFKFNDVRKFAWWHEKRRLCRSRLRRDAGVDLLNRNNKHSCRESWNFLTSIIFSIHFIDWDYRVYAVHTVQSFLNTHSIPIQSAAHHLTNSYLASWYFSQTEVLVSRFCNQQVCQLADVLEPADITVSWHILNGILLSRTDV